MPRKSRRGGGKKPDLKQLSLLDYVPPASAPRSKSKSPQKAQPPIRASLPSMHAAEVRPDGVITASEAARYLKLSLATLKSWRSKKTGPAFVKRGARLIGYRFVDLEAFLESQP